MAELTPSRQAELAERFRTRISPFISRHAETLPADDARRLLAQVTPDALELVSVPGYDNDPLHEEDADIHPFPDIVRKYRSKVLYLTTDECPVYCRYCTRKRKTLLSTGHAATELADIAAYLTERPEINEIIFSGGDPLMLPLNDLTRRADFFLSLATIRFLRLHTRAVTMAPGLLSERFFSMLEQLRTTYATKQIAMVLHINTAAELSETALLLINRLRHAGISLFSQTVLLRGINDSAESLATLCATLIKTGVQPYYLHQLDRVTGSAHFEVPEAEGRQIYSELSTRIPPYMLPRYVRDSKQGKYPL